MSQQQSGGGIIIHNGKTVRQVTEQDVRDLIAGTPSDEVKQMLQYMLPSEDQGAG